MIYADFHIHSRFSRGTSKNLNIEEIYRWSLIKGINIIATGDITHPEWFNEIKTKLVPEDNGLLSLKKEYDPCIKNKRGVNKDIKFILTGEISTIYKKGDRVRKIHHLVCFPDFESVERFNKKLSKIGNLSSDGRPILGLDSRILLEILLESNENAFLIPAHIWTPWFSLFGSNSGFDFIEECYEDLTPHIFALETGLSSDPPMNWKVSALDRFRLVSNSDAHSGEKIGRECNIFDCELNYIDILNALKTGKGYAGTVEFFPEEGKYHLDGHRKCGVIFTPGESLAHNNQCPVCGKALTLGVLHRVEELSDREEPRPPEIAGEVKYLVPLKEILSEIFEAGANTKKVNKEFEKLINLMGSEIFILLHSPLEDIGKSSNSLLMEGIKRLREGRVIKRPGYDGEYGIIKLFEKEELERLKRGSVLFDKEKNRKKVKATGKKKTKLYKTRISEKESQESSKILLPDPHQEKAINSTDKVVLVIAGPGSGKTFTLTSRIVKILEDKKAKPEDILTVTFSRKARDELFSRLERLIGSEAVKINIHTFHSLGIEILKGNLRETGLSADGFNILTDLERMEIIENLKKHSKLNSRKILHKISYLKRTGELAPDERMKNLFKEYQKMLKEKNLIDLDDILPLVIKLFKEHPSILEKYQNKFQWILVDEYQDVDTLQHNLVKLLYNGKNNLFVIGDPDQSIYSFRGSSPEFIRSFKKDFSEAVEIRLNKNYRSSPFIECSASHIAGKEKNIGNLKEGEGIILHSSPTDNSEAEFIVKNIEQIIGGHSFFSIDSGRADGKGKNYSFNDFAVLLRTTKQYPPIIEALKRSGIPFRLYSHNPVIEKEEVRKLISKLKKQGKIMLQQEDLNDALIEVKNSGYNFDEYLEQYLVKIMEKSEGNLKEFLLELSYLMESDLYDKRADAVSIMTIHASKGLEFRVIFIPGCEEGIIPLRFGENNLDVEEEKRLFYVGITRAREKVFLIKSQKRKWRGRVQCLPPSRFLSLIPENLIKNTKFTPRGKKNIKSSQLPLFQE